MTESEAKKLLLAFRPEAHDPADPQLAAALALVRTDPALRRWFESQTQFQKQVRRSLEHIPVPPDLRAHILSHSRVVTPAPWLRRPVWLAAAAAILLLIGLSAWWVRPDAEASFNTFRSRMVRTVLRQYAMDLVTSDMTNVQQFLATNGAPSNYSLTPNLARLTPSGAGLLRWGNRPVSMVCLNSADHGTLFLFVVESSAVQQPLKKAPAFLQVSKLMTVSWTRDGLAYVLAGTGDKETLERDLGPVP